MCVCACVRLSVRVCVCACSRGAQLERRDVAGLVERIPARQRSQPGAIHTCLCVDR